MTLRMVEVVDWDNWTQPGKMSPVYLEPNVPKIVKVTQLLQVSLLAFSSHDRPQMIALKVDGHDTIKEELRDIIQTRMMVLSQQHLFSLSPPYIHDFMHNPLSPESRAWQWDALRMYWVVQMMEL